MKNRLKGLGFFSFSVACFYYSYYWYGYHTDHSLLQLIRQYSFFTNQTILLLSFYMMGVSLYYLGWKKAEKILFSSVVKTGITSYVFAVSLGYYIGVARFYLTSWNAMYVAEIQSIFMHFIAPVVVGLTYHVTPFVGKIKPTEGILLAVYPLFYLYYAAFYTKAWGEYIYPILDPNIMGGVGEILCVIPLAFLGFWLITLCVGNRHNLYTGEKGKPI